MPSPSGTTTAFSVCRKPANRGAADGLCIVMAVMYCSSAVFKQARSQSLAAAKAGALNARRQTTMLNRVVIRRIIGLLPPESCAEDRRSHNDGQSKNDGQRSE